MKKDTIYIDIEDDITAVVGKVKASDGKVVALVPPKRIGILQSAVNLRLLARVAEQGDKHLVLVTGNQALTKLAASAGIPSARTLQSKPVLPPTPHSEDSSEEEIINGDELPVGDIARAGDQPLDDTASALAAAAVDSTIRDNVAEDIESSLEARPNNQNRVKVPSFDAFRKRLILIIAGVILVSGTLVWAIMFAPKAKIIITANTIKSSANVKIRLVGTDGKTSVEDSTLRSVAQSAKKEVSIEFEATGEKEVGEKATGQIVFRNCRSVNPITIAAGTGVSAGGKTYITQAAVTVPGGGSAGWPPSCAPGVSSPVAVVAQNIGEGYNLANGTLCVAEYDCSGLLYMRATVSTAIGGGTSRKVKVPTKEDVEKATEELTRQDSSEIKKQLVGQFGEGVAILEDSMRTQSDEVKPQPAVGEEVGDGKAKLVGVVTYTMMGVDRSELTKFLDERFTKEIKDKNSQKIYDNGAKSASFVDAMHSDRDGYTATLVATAKFGPQIDEGALKTDVQGKRYSEVQAHLNGISGIKDVGTQFSPFWVSSVPRDETRITIEFKLDES